MNAASVIALLLGLAGVASAETHITVTREAEPSPAIRFGTPSDGGRLVRADFDELQQGRLRVEIAGTSTRGADVAMAIHLPAGARVTAMSVTIRGRASVASFVSQRRAVEQYRATVRAAEDPALLEYLGSNGDEGFLLHVFPVTKRDHAVVEITLDAPGLTRAGDDWMQADPTERPVVSQDVSLYAAGPTREVPTIVIGCMGYSEERSLDKKIIRRQVKLAEPRLANCWHHELFHAPTLEGTAELHFMILPSGAVDDVSVGGTLGSDAVARCMSEDIAKWQFPATEGATRVNYPLTLKLPGE